MCEAFTEIASGTTGSGSTTEEGGEDRAVLLAGSAYPPIRLSGYPLINDLPDDVRNDSTAHHTQTPDEANAFIAFAKDECEVG
jgi:hypothetical protein